MEDLLNQMKNHLQTKVNNEEQELFNGLKRGKYRECYLIYNRKSTDEPHNQKNSIQYQKNENIAFLVNQKLCIAQISISGFCTDGIISEKHSGFSEGEQFIISGDGMVQYLIDRPKFHRLVHYLSLGMFKGVVCLCWDRISRNKGDNVVVEKLMKRGIDIQFSHAVYDDTSSGMLHMDIDGVFSQHHSRVTSEKVLLAFKKSRAEGKCITKAPIGYLNEGNMDRKPFDPIRAPIIKRMFELYATGEWSLADIARYAQKQGLTSVPRRRRRTKKEILSDEDDDGINNIPKTKRLLPGPYIHRILTNPFYTGVTRGNNNMWVKSISHDALISKELFDTVKLMLSKKKTSIHYTQKLSMPYRGFIRCSCGRVYSPYIQKGIQYFYSRCTAKCKNTQKSISISKLESLISEQIKRLVLSDKEINQLETITRTDIAVLENKQQTKIEEIERSKTKIREDLKYLRDNKLPLLRVGAYTPEKYIEEEQRLMEELEHWRIDEEAIDLSMSETIKDVIKLSELLNDAYFIYLKANSSEKDPILRNIFSELIISENTLKTKCKKGLQALEIRLNSYSARYTWIFELSQIRNDVKFSIQELENKIL